MKSHAEMKAFAQNIIDTHIPVTDEDKSEKLADMVLELLEEVKSYKDAVCDLKHSLHETQNDYKAQVKQFKELASQAKLFVTKDAYEKLQAQLEEALETQLKLINELKYIGGIVCKGEKREIKPEEITQSAILNYVIKLEAQLASARACIDEQRSVIQTVAKKFAQTSLSKLVSENAADIRNRFSEKILKNGECLEWIGSLSPQGYGQLSIKNRPYLAHRISLALTMPDFYDFYVVDHKCMNKKCVNPDHLRCVGHSLNTTENSESVSSFFKVATHCKNGHEYTSDNTRYKWNSDRSTKNRICKTCEIEWRKNSKARKWLAENKDGTK